MFAKIHLDDEPSPDPLSRPFTDHRALIEEFSAHFIARHWPLKEKPEGVIVSLTFLTPEAMAEVNGAHRNEPSVTDVLSFPLWDFAGGEEPLKGPEGLPLGDVVFCLDRCRENAFQHQVTPESEVALLWCHSLLHLLGYDHVTVEEEAHMWQLQQAGAQELTALLQEVTQ